MKAPKAGKAQPVLCTSARGRSLLAGWKKSIRMVATDVDGTLTIESPGAPAELKGCISPEAVESIRALVIRGIPVALVTGRPLATAEGLAMYLGLTSRERTERGCPIIAENGAVIKTGGEIIRLSDRQAAASAVQAMRRSGILPETGFLTWDNHLRHCDVGLDSSVVDPEAVTRWLAKHPRLGMKAFTSNIMTHIVSKKISKAAALCVVLNESGISPDEVAVFGDSDTDVPLFGEFPMSGVPSNYFKTVGGWKNMPMPAIKSALPGGVGFAQIIENIFR